MIDLALEEALTGDALPDRLFTTAQVREIDRLAMEQQGLGDGKLMERAGYVAFRLLRKHWPSAMSISIFCGGGNNGGDGYLLGKFCHLSGLQVNLFAIGEVEQLTGDAKNACEKYLAVGGILRKEAPQFEDQSDLAVDGIFGIGLHRHVNGKWREAILLLNRWTCPVLSLDIPSGLDSDSGQVQGVAVQADVTISFVGLKQGLFLGAASSHCGQLYFHDLGIPAEVMKAFPLVLHQLRTRSALAPFKPRRVDDHKGHFGHVLVVGGDHGFGGAALLAGKASVRAGAGLVSIATREAHLTAILASCPEIMARGVSKPEELAPLLHKVSVICLGPGLGQSAWSRGLFAKLIDQKKPLVMDADALNLLALEPIQRTHWILTPHPGEAARLLNCKIAEIQRDRFGAVKALQEMYGGVILLKGAGTLLFDGKHPMMINTNGNPGMATGGMGDVLTGLIGALIAQGFSLWEAACSGAFLHGKAGDVAAGRSPRGLIATDLIAEIRRQVNAEGCSAHSFNA